MDHSFWLGLSRDGRLVLDRRKTFFPEGLGKRDAPTHMDLADPGHPRDRPPVCEFGDPLGLAYSGRRFISLFRPHGNSGPKVGIFLLSHPMSAFLSVGVRAFLSMGALVLVLSLAASSFILHSGPLRGDPRLSSLDAGIRSVALFRFFRFQLLGLIRGQVQCSLQSRSIAGIRNLDISGPFLKGALGPQKGFMVSDLGHPSGGRFLDGPFLAGHRFAGPFPLFERVVWVREGEVRVRSGLWDPLVVLH